MSDDTVNERIPVGRGRMVSVVGRVGAERVNLDVATADDVMCSELTRDEAGRLRDALDAFLGGPTVDTAPAGNASSPLSPQGVKG